MRSKSNSQNTDQSDSVDRGGDHAQKFREVVLYVSTALIALFPVIYFRSLIGRLFWFGDDFAFIEDIRQLGFANWFPRAFGENYLPLFKAYWSGIFFMGGGSSTLAIQANWVLHAFNSLILLRILRAVGFSRLAAAAGAGVFAIAAGNVEVLTWSMGGSTILACTFLLLAVSTLGAKNPTRWPNTLGATGWIVAGTLAHARGVVAGPALAAAAFLDDSTELKVGARIARSALLILPSIAVGTAIFFLAPDNHQEVLASTDKLFRAARFGYWYIAANPYVGLVAANGQTWTCFDLSTWLVVVLGVFKFATFYMAISASSGRRRSVMIALVVADLCTAGLLGLGRSDGDPPLAMSSRYQYGSLICALPPLLASIEQLWMKLKLSKNVSAVLIVGVFAWAVVLNIKLWNGLLPSWVLWRGDGTRKILSVATRPDQRDLPGADFITNDEARGLVKRFDLH